MEGLLSTGPTPSSLHCNQCYKTLQWSYQVGGSNLTDSDLAAVGDEVGVGVLGTDAANMVELGLFVL